MILGYRDRETERFASGRFVKDFQGRATWKSWTITSEGGSRVLKRAVHPGRILKDELTELGITPTEFARQIDVPANRISQIINGKRSITGDTALRFGHWFGVEPVVLAESPGALRPGMRRQGSRGRSSPPAHESVTRIGAQARQPRFEISGVAAHQHRDLPVRRWLMLPDAYVSEPPTSRNLRRQVRADAAMESEQQVVKGQRREDPVGDGKLGAGDPLRQQRRELPIAQDPRGGFDVAGGRMRRASRSRIHASSTGSPSIAMELAT